MNAVSKLPLLAEPLYGVTARLTLGGARILEKYRVDPRTGKSAPISDDDPAGRTFDEFIRLNLDDPRPTGKTVTLRIGYNELMENYS